jgi:ribosomal protein S27E
VKADEHPEKPLNEGIAVVKCPKCRHEFKCESGWIKASVMIGCPKCLEMIRLPTPRAIDFRVS